MVFFFLRLFCFPRSTISARSTASPRCFSTLSPTCTVTNTLPPPKRRQTEKMINTSYRHKRVRGDECDHTSGGAGNALDGGVGRHFLVLERRCCCFVGCRAIKENAPAWRKGGQRKRKPESSACRRNVFDAPPFFFPSPAANSESNRLDGSEIRLHIPPSFFCVPVSPLFCLSLPQLTPAMPSVFVTGGIGYIGEQRFG